MPYSATPKTPALRNSDGEPVGNENASKVIAPPNGITVAQWQHIIELAVGNFRLTAGIGEPTRNHLVALDIDEVIPKNVWDLLFNYAHNLERFQGALAVRGVLPLGRGITAEQSIALEIISDPMNRSLATALRKADVKQATFDKWMHHAPFAEQMKLIAERRLNQVQPLVDMEVTRQAVGGSLEAIKYFDKKTGRDPDKKQEMDGRKVIQIVIDVLAKHLTEQPELLRQIAAELEVRTKANGDVYK